MPQLLQMLRNNSVGTTEVHWIAATLWNLALDHYGLPLLETGGSDLRAGDLQNCHKWAQHAISISRFVGDGGILEKTVCSQPF